MINQTGIYPPGIKSFLSGESARPGRPWQNTTTLGRPDGADCNKPQECGGRRTAIFLPVFNVVVYWVIQKAAFEYVHCLITAVGLLGVCTVQLEVPPIEAVRHAQHLVGHLFSRSRRVDQGGREERRHGEGGLDGTKRACVSGSQHINRNETPAILDSLYV